MWNGKELNEDNLMVIINPKIVYKSQKTTDELEGCLSIPNWYGLIQRSNDINVEYSTLDSLETVQKNFNGLIARIFLHEYDHLYGKLWIDYIESINEINSRVFCNYNKEVYKVCGIPYDKLPKLDLKIFMNE